MLGSLLLVMSQQAVATFFHSKSKKVLYNSVSQKTDSHIWDFKDIILEHYMHIGTIINSEAYYNLLESHFKPAIRSKR